MIRKSADSYWCYLYIAGDIDKARPIIQEYVKMGLCVTVEPVSYIFTGGSEEGMRIGFINYARFPKDDVAIRDIAGGLGMMLMNELGQLSFTLLDPYTSTFIAKPEKEEA